MALLIEQQAGRLDRPALVVLPTSLLFTPMSNAEPVNDFYDAIPGDVGDPGSVIRTEPLALAGAEKLIRREIDGNAHKALLDELASEI